MRYVAWFLICLPFTVFSQEKSEIRELTGHVGSRSALLVLQATERREGGWQVSGTTRVKGRSISPSRPAAS